MNGHTRTSRIVGPMQAAFEKVGKAGNVLLVKEAPLAIRLGREPTLEEEQLEFGRLQAQRELEELASGKDVTESLQQETTMNVSNSSAAQVKPEQIQSQEPLRNIKERIFQVMEDKVARTAVMIADVLEKEGYGHATTRISVGQMVREGYLIPHNPNAIGRHATLWELSPTAVMPTGGKPYSKQAAYTHKKEQVTKAATAIQVAKPKAPAVAAPKVETPAVVAPVVNLPAPAKVEVKAEDRVSHMYEQITNTLTFAETVELVKRLVNPY